MSLYRLRPRPATQPKPATQPRGKAAKKAKRSPQHSRTALAFVQARFCTRKRNYRAFHSELGELYRAAGDRSETRYRKYVCTRLREPRDLAFTRGDGVADFYEIAENIFLWKRDAPKDPLFADLYYRFLFLLPADVQDALAAPGDFLPGVRSADPGDGCSDSEGS